MGIEEQIDKLIDLGEDIKSRLDRMVELASDHFADANKMVADEPAKEPPKKWRILGVGEEVQEGDKPGEVVCSGDWVNALRNKPDEDPPGGGWIPARASLIGRETSQAIGLYFARPVVDEPAKEPEHPAGPMPDPGEGYRILSKEPPEDLTPGDEFENGNGEWIRSSNAETHKKQGANCWYRRKIETHKPPEPEYREPVLPADAGKYCQFSNDGIEWRTGWLNGWGQRSHQWISHSGGHWRHARIKKES